uniref:hypothetical protein n=1 Tax=Prevotella sp. TaxID=59823 RepID=UPI004028ECE8
MPIITQHRKESRAMQGIAAQTGMSGSAWLPFTKKLAIGARKNRCISYMLNESREKPVIKNGAS